MKVKKICFFSKGFAFNRLVRLRYYEKIFPKNVQIFLITTDKYQDQKSWNLKRTKIHVLKNNPLKNLFQIRRFCNKNQIDRVSNLGHPFGIIPLIFASFFKDRDILLYYLGDVLEIYKTTKKPVKKAKLFLILIPYFVLSKISKKSAFVGFRSYKKSPQFFLSKKEKFHYLVAPVNTDLFKPQNRILARKKLKIPKDKKLILFVGRVTYQKGGDLLSEMIKKNPTIDFIVIGKWSEKEVPLLKSKNLKFIEKVPNEKLPLYYSSADLVFVYNRQGDQPQIVGSESLACGIPVIHTERFHAPEKDFIIKIKDNPKDANNKIKNFFNFPKKKTLLMSQEARKYALNVLSDEAWKKKYIDFYLT